MKSASGFVNLALSEWKISAMKTMNENLVHELKSALRIEDEFRADGHELKAQGRNLVTICPFHSENTESCVVHPEEQYFKCHGCGKGGDVMSYLSLVKFQRKEVSDREFVEVLRMGCERAGIEFIDSAKPVAFKPPEEKKIFPTIEKIRACCDFMAVEAKERIAEWNEYTHPVSKAIELVTVRFESTVKKRKNGKPAKRFFQISPCEGGYYFGRNPGKMPLFNRTRIAETGFVVFVEGEKCVRFLLKLGIIATCAAGGAKNGVENTDWTPLAGKSVVLWPDNAKDGIGYAESVQKEISKLPGVISGIVAVDGFGLNENEDVVEFWESRHGTDQDRSDALAAEIQRAMPETLESQIAADMAGTRYALRHPAYNALSSTLCFLPGTITMLCANPGVSKSLLVLQWIWQMYFDGCDCAMLALESGNVFHQRRTLAQMAGNSYFLNPDWVKNNHDESVALMEKYMPMINTIRNEKVIQSPNFAEVNPGYLLSWISQEAKRGRKMLVIDPITMMETGPNFWEEQKSFVRSVKRIVEKTQIRLLLVTHPKTGCLLPSLNGMAGAIAFSQNSDTTIWLEAHSLFQKVEETYSDSGKPVIRDYNRTMHILKSRLGPAKTKFIGYLMNGATLTHDEIGFVDARENA